MAAAAGRLPRKRVRIGYNVFWRFGVFLGEIGRPPRDGGQEPNRPQCILPGARNKKLAKSGKKCYSLVVY